MPCDVSETTQLDVYLQGGLEALQGQPTTELASNAKALVACGDKDIRILLFLRKYANPLPVKQMIPDDLLKIVTEANGMYLLPFSWS